jgi:fused signal recognition particle receptor
MQWFEKLQQGLRKSAKFIGGGLKSVFSESTASLSGDQIESVFELLIQGDVGVEAADKICNMLKSKSFSSADEAMAAIALEIEMAIAKFSSPFSVSRQGKPSVILVSGVNGSGKTTTIAKLTKKCIDQGLSVEWGACDTFRAAATEQLLVWGQRLGVNTYSNYRQTTKPDPASLAFFSLEEATKRGTDALFIDTAGRLQNNDQLMHELAKIARVLKKIDPAAPTHSLLVVDATTGQNAHSQVNLFQRYIPLTGIVVTKLDGTSKAGFLVELCKKTSIPVVAIGVGEGLDDMDYLDPHAFANGLVFGKADTAGGL